MLEQWDLRDTEWAALLRDDPRELAALFGYDLTRCPGGGPCLYEAEWGRRCPRDEHSVLECERPRREQSC